MASNLPPGVTVGMIPGNRPEDAAWEAAEEWALEKLSEANLSLDEYRRAILIGIAAVVAERDEIEAIIKDVRADERMVAEMENSP